MQVVLRDGPRKGDVFEVGGKDGDIFPVIMTNDHKYAYAEYMIVPGQSLLRERLATFVNIVEREKK
jgi:hypothetical protein